LQQWYRLSDVELEEALLDRLSFRRFVGVGLDESVPDSTTLCRFRNDLAAAGLAERLFAEMNKQLEKQGLILKRGTLIDATLVEAAVQPSGSAEAPSDPDAAFARRAGRSSSTFGYKAHVAVDEKSGLVRDALLTPANVNETVVADDLIQGDEGAVYADKAYDSHARSELLKKLGIKNRIQRRGNKHHPMAPRMVLRNVLIGKVRGRVETTFAVLKRHYRWARVRYVGSSKNLSHLHLLCIALNLRRALVLTA
jgi:IS5 family transposase